ncbi:MAG: MobF family relaxase [Acidimicrobiales bacterium]
MLRMAKVHHGGDRYYFQTVRAATDRPDGLIEADPYWLGSGSVSLGLSGSATEEEVRALFTGASPSTGEKLRAPGTVEVANVAFDITFSVPKSVSLVHALASSEACARIQHAHEAAVEASLGYLEREALCARRSGGGERFGVAVEGAVAVGFLHRTSRANDPHLHTHVLVGNLGRGADGRWTALDARPLYGAQRPARALFEAQLRAGLTDIGIELGPMRRDFADISSITRATVRQFSRQSEAVVTAMRAAGLSGPRAAAELATAIRPPKDRSRPYEALQEEWRERGYEMGLSQSRIERAAGVGARPRTPVREVGTSWITTAGNGVDGTCSRADLIVARCVSLSEGASVDQVERDVSDALEHGGLVATGHGGLFVSPSLQATLRDASGRLARLGDLAGAKVLCYDAPASRPRHLDDIARLASECAEAGAHVLAVAPGRRAAAGLEAVTGLETFPVREIADLRERLCKGDVVVVSDCGAMVEAELHETLSLCVEKRAQPVLFGAASSMESSRLLDGLRAGAEPLGISELPVGRGPFNTEPLVWHFGPGVRAALVSDASSACVEASRQARELATAGGAVMIVVPDRSLRQLLDQSASRLPVLDGRRAGAVLDEHLTRGLQPPVPVIIGGAATLGLDLKSLARLERTHVLVSTHDESSRGRAAEAVGPFYLIKTLGAVRSGAARRPAWREAAGLIEDYRDRHGLTEAAGTYGSGPRTPGRRRDEALIRRRIAELGPALSLTVSRRQGLSQPEHRLGR